MVANMNELRNLKRPQSDDELEDRIQWFFEWCIEHDQRPGVELMALSCGVTRQTLWQWQQQGGRRGELIDRAKQVIAALLESWGQTGKINPATLIFLLKNHFNYHDDVQLEVGPVRQELEPQLSPEEVQAQLDEDIPIDYPDGDDPSF